MQNSNPPKISLDPPSLPDPTIRFCGYYILQIVETDNIFANNAVIFAAGRSMGILFEIERLEERPQHFALSYETGGVAGW